MHFTPAWEKNSHITLELFLKAWVMLPSGARAPEAIRPTRSGHDRSIEGPRSRTSIVQPALPLDCLIGLCLRG